MLSLLSRMVVLKYWLVLILVILIIKPSSQDLFATQCQATLKSPRSATASVYDGKDTVYTLGGWIYDPESELIPYADIHAYNVTSDTIRVIGQLPRTSWDGLIHYDELTRQIYMLRGDGTFLWKIDPSTGSTTSLTEWLGSSAGISGAFTADGKLLTFGGLDDPLQIYQYDFSTGSQGPVGTLARNSELSVGIHVSSLQSTYIFAGKLGFREPILLQYDHEANVTNVLKTVFPSWRHGDGVLVNINDSSIFVLGAAVDNGARGNGFVEFRTQDPGFVEFIPVQGLPAELTSFSAVYVQGIRRMYIFGGYDLTNTDRGEIWYVQL